jgi:hypothetical protein
VVVNDYLANAGLPSATAKPAAASTSLRTTQCNHHKIDEPTQAI